MRRKKAKPIKIPPSIRQVVLVLIGFGAGYTANQLVGPIASPHVYQAPSQHSVVLAEGLTSVCFTPGKKCQLQILGEINKAKGSIYVQAYSFTDRDIAQALVAAAQRGVKVQVLLDKSNRNDKRSAKDLIMKHNLGLWFDAPPGIAHNKIMVIDEKIVVTGSYNFSNAAYTRNTENLLIINNPGLAQQYLNNWQKRREVSTEQGANKNG